MKLTAALAGLAMTVAATASFAQALPDLEGKEIVIVTENAYHGVTLSTAAMSPSLGAGVPLPVIAMFSCSYA